MKQFLIFALATWRISSLLVHEDGPFAMFEHIRLRVGVYYDAESNRVADSELGKLFLCVWCMSMWVALGLFVSHRVLRGPTSLLARINAWSAVACLIEMSYEE